MKRGGQISTLDMLIAASVFITIFVASVSLWGNSLLQIQRFEERRVTTQKAFDASELLATQAGDPPNWHTMDAADVNTSSVRNVGLAESAGVLSREKVERFTELDYEAVTLLLGLGREDFNVTVRNATYGILYSAGKPVGDSVTLARRVCLLDDELVYLDVLLSPRQAATTTVTATSSTSTSSLSTSSTSTSSSSSTITAGTPILYLSPQTQSVASGQQATVGVVIQDVADLYGVMFTVAHSGSVLTASDATEGSFLSCGGVSTVFGRTINANSIEVFASRQGTVPGCTGSGTIATLTYSADSAGASPLTIQSAELSDSQLQVIAAVTQDGSVTVT